MITRVTTAIDKLCAPTTQSPEWWDEVPSSPTHGTPGVSASGRVVPPPGDGIIPVCHVGDQHPRPGAPPPPPNVVCDTPTIPVEDRILLAGDAIDGMGHGILAATAAAGSLTVRIAGTSPTPRPAPLARMAPSLEPLRAMVCGRAECCIHEQSAEIAAAPFGPSIHAAGASADVMQRSFLLEVGWGEESSGTAARRAPTEALGRLVGSVVDETALPVVAAPWRLPGGAAPPGTSPGGGAGGVAPTRPTAEPSPSAMATAASASAQRGAREGTRGVQLGCAVKDLHVVRGALEGALEQVQESLRAAAALVPTARMADGLAETVEDAGLVPLWGKAGRPQLRGPHGLATAVATLDLLASASESGVTYWVCTLCSNGTATSDEVADHFTKKHNRSHDSVFVQPLTSEFVVQRATRSMCPFVTAYTLETPIYRLLNRRLREAAPPPVYPTIDALRAAFVHVTPSASLQQAGLAVAGDVDRAHPQRCRRSSIDSSGPRGGVCRGNCSASDAAASAAAATASAGPTTTPSVPRNGALLTLGALSTTATAHTSATATDIDATPVAMAAAPRDLGSANSALSVCVVGVGARLAANDIDVALEAADVADDDDPEDNALAVAVMAQAVAAGSAAHAMAVRPPPLLESGITTTRVCESTVDTLSPSDVACSALSPAAPPLGDLHKVEVEATPPPVCGHAAGASQSAGAAPPGGADGPDALTRAPSAASSDAPSSCRDAAVDEPPSPAVVSAAAVPVDPDRTCDVATGPPNSLGSPKAVAPAVTFGASVRYGMDARSESSVAYSPYMAGGSGSAMSASFATVDDAPPHVRSRAEYALRFKEFHAGLDAELQGLQRYVGTVYRGIDCRVSSFEYCHGAVVTWNAPSSASVDPRVAREFLTQKLRPCGTLFVVQSRSGRRVSEYSDFPKEDEVLFRAGCQFRVGSAVTESTRDLLASALRCDLTDVGIVVLDELETGAFRWDAQCAAFRRGLARDEGVRYAQALSLFRAKGSADGVPLDFELLPRAALVEMVSAAVATRGVGVPFLRYLLAALSSTVADDGSRAAPCGDVVHPPRVADASATNLHPTPPRLPGVTESNLLVSGADDDADDDGDDDALQFPTQRHASRLARLTIPTSIVHHEAGQPPTELCPEMRTTTARLHAWIRGLLAHTPPATAPAVYLLHRLGRWPDPQSMHASSHATLAWALLSSMPVLPSSRVRELLLTGFVVNPTLFATAEDANGLAVVHHAAVRGWGDVIDAALMLGQCIDQPSGGVDYLIRQARPLAESASGRAACRAHRWSPLHVCVQHAVSAGVQLLLQRGASVNARDASGATSLHFAASGLRCVLVAELLAAGADPNALTHNGWSPYKLAELARGRCVEGAHVGAARAALAASSLFCQLPSESLDALVRGMSVRYALGGEALCSVGDAGCVMFILLGGRAVVLTSERVPVAVLRKGACIGEISLVLDTSRTASVLALHPGCTVAALTRSRLIAAAADSGTDLDALLARARAIHRRNQQASVAVAVHSCESDNDCDP